MSTNNSDLQSLQRSIEQSKVARAATLTDAERLRAGADLYDEGMKWLAFAIRADNPEFTAEQVDEEIERRKRIVRRIDDNGLYRPCGVAEADG